MLSLLPPELRSQIYSYVFSSEDEEYIVLRAAPRDDFAGAMGLPPRAKLLQDPRYNHYHRRTSTRGRWPDAVEEVFHKGDPIPVLNVQSLIVAGQLCDGLTPINTGSTEPMGSTRI